MGYPRDLLDAAWAIANSAPENQAHLRRAVSTAYYALFHLLIEEACVNWANADQRNRLARQFDHKRMKDASVLAARRSGPGSDLFAVGNTFSDLQENRREADYDLAGSFSITDVMADLASVEFAFQAWERIREHDAAQDYLFSLLFFSLLFKDRS